jgi:hypothetical protein
VSILIVCLKRRYKMKVIWIIAAISVSVGTFFLLACSEEKTASIVGHEDIVAVIQKVPQCGENPSIVHEIYAEDAIVKYEYAWIGVTNYTGLKEIESMHRAGKNWRIIEISIESIEKEADIAHVKYRYKVDNSREVFKRSDSAEMRKNGETWKITEVNSELRP